MNWNEIGVFVAVALAGFSGLGVLVKSWFDGQNETLREIHDKVDGQAERISYLEGAARIPFRGEQEGSIPK